MVKEGLRERSKARRNEEITRAAFELFAEQGYDATTVADIAERAEVSPRTVALYFRTKQDIALSRFGEGADRLTAAMRARRHGERAVDVVARWLRDEGEQSSDLDELERRMFLANPQLAALRTARMAEAIEESTRVVAEDLGVAEDALEPRIAATAATAVIIDLFAGPLDFDLERAILLAVRFLEAGLDALTCDAP